MSRSLRRYGIPAALLTISVPLMMIPPEFSDLREGLSTGLQVGGWIIYFLSTDWLLLQICRAPPTASARARFGRLLASLMLGAPPMGLLGLFLLTARDVMWMALPYAAAPLIIVGPFWIAAMRRVLAGRSAEASPEPLHDS